MPDAPSGDPPADARAGNLDALFALIGSDLGGREAYKWLCVAHDYGHPGAADLIGDVLEVSDLRYDDGGYEQAATHWELGVAYLTGAEGLSVDHALARSHFEEAFEGLDLEAINAGTGRSYSADELRARLDSEAAAVLDAALTFAHDPYRAVIRRVDRLRRLRELGAPKVIVDNEGELLREAVAELIDEH